MDFLDRPSSVLQTRHIQDYSSADSLEPHWGYFSRVLPCTNDAGSCEYLDVVYWMHDVSMLYTFIMWAVIVGILFIWAFYIRVAPSRRQLSTNPHHNDAVAAPRQSWFYRSTRSMQVALRRHLLPESLIGIFGRVTRLQVLVLAILSGYLLVFSLVGVVYKTWVTPVEGMSGVYNTRTGIGPWGDRIGALAYALTPLTILLSSRESLLSLITGLPYQSFNFLHRWTGYIIFVQSFLHTLAWTVVEGKLYQPQPSVWVAFMSERYIIWGVIAMVFLSCLLISSTQWCIRLTGYEFFRKAHYVLAMLYIGACWGHWNKLYPWLLSSLVVWFLDRGIRLVRTALLHHQYLEVGNTTGMGFKTISASIAHFRDSAHGDVIRLDFDHIHGAWNIGQHFYLCFPQLTIWQAHPFTPLNIPNYRHSRQTHSYIVRSKKGQTKKLATLATAVQSSGSSQEVQLILTGPYGQAILDNDPPSKSDVNVLCIAGGTGITYVLPVIMNLVQSHPNKNRSLELIWVVRRSEDLHWIRVELASLRNSAKELGGFDIRIFVTREGMPGACPVCDVAQADTIADSGSSSSEGHTEKATTKTGQSISIKEPRVTSVSSPNRATSHRPNLPSLINSFVSNTAAGPTCVYASGPGGMISDIRKAVAASNDAGKVYNGDERWDVQLICDNRLEY